MLWKRKLLIVAVWILVVAAGAAITMRMPRRYRAEAVIMLDSDTIPNSYVASTVSTDAQGRLMIIQQQLLSRARLKLIADEFHLYPQHASSKNEEDMLDAVRRDISIQPDKNSTETRLNGMLVSYSGLNAVKVAQVTNRIASIFINETLKSREIQAEGTASFIETQLETAKQRLDELESSMSQYKLSHNGELPEQENAILSALSRLQSDLQTNTDALGRLQESRSAAEDALLQAENTAARLLQTRNEAAQQRTVAIAPAHTPAAATADRPPTPSQQIAQELEELRAHYSEQHPEVKRLEFALQNAQRLERDQQRSLPKTQPVSTGSVSETRAEPPDISARAMPWNALDTEIARTRDHAESLRKQISALGNDIDARKRNMGEIQAQLSVYQSRVDRLPVREQELARIMRDYQISKLNYQGLLDKKLAADMAADLERRQKSARFTLLEPARVPKRPFEPNVPRLIAIVCVAGIVLGIALAIALEVSRGHLLGAWELPPDVVLLASVPVIKPSRSKLRLLQTG